MLGKHVTYTRDMCTYHGGTCRPGKLDDVSNIKIVSPEFKISLKTVVSKVTKTLACTQAHK